MIFPAPLTTIGSGTRGTHPEGRPPRPTTLELEPPSGQLSSESPEGSSIEDRPAATPPTAPAEAGPLFKEYKNIFICWVVDLLQVNRLFTKFLPISVVRQTEEG